MTSRSVAVQGLVALLVLLALGLAAWFGLRSVGSTHRSLAAWSDRPDRGAVDCDPDTPDAKACGLVLIEGVFEKLISLELMALDTRTFEISLPACGDALPPGPGELQSDRERAQERSCRSVFRPFLRTPVDAWNASLRGVGVREAATVPGADVLGPQAAFVYRDSDGQPVWEALTQARLDDGRAITFPAEALSAGGIDPDVFGFLTCQRPFVGFGDWQSASGSPVLLSRSLKAGDDLRVQFAADGQAIEYETEGAVLVEAPIGQCLQANQADRGLMRCPRAGSLSKRCAAGQPAVWTFRVAARTEGRVTFSLQGQPMVPTVLTQFKGAEFVKSAGAEHDPDTDIVVPVPQSPMEIRCWIEGGRRYCRLAWAAPLIPVPDAAGKGGIRIAGETLSDGEGPPLLPEGDPEGLRMLIGVGPEDYVSAALAQSGAPLSLTIDRDMQRKAVDTLRSALTDPEGFRGVRPGRLPGLGDPDATPERTGAIVLMAVDGAQAGDVLAAASWPEPTQGLSVWDIQAMRRWSPLASPLEPVAYGVRENAQTAGSTFKIVSALSLIESALAEPDRNLVPLLSGVDGKTLAEQTGLTCKSNELFVPGRRISIQNAGGKDVAVCPPRPVGLCAKGRAVEDPARIGLCEAIAKSSNIWFAQMALLNERGSESVTNDDGISVIGECPPPRSAPGAADTSLLGLSERLGWDRGVDLVTGARNAVGFSYAHSPAPYLGVSTLGDAEDGCHKLALNAYGQDVQVTPLAMAAYVAGVARQDLTPPVPRLFSGRSLRSGESRAAPKALVGPADDSALRDSLIASLRLGMQAVVNDPEGTAARSFCVDPAAPETDECAELAEIRPRIHAKTGTATLSGEEGNKNDRVFTVWMVGWIEPALPNRPGLKTRLAFACMVTHVGDEAGGGSVCGPIMARLLLDLDVAARSTP